MKSEPAYRPRMIERFQVLDESGATAAPSHLGTTVQLTLYRSMLRGRLFDELLLKLQRRGDIGTFAPVKGQEAQVGAVAAIDSDDWFVPSFRETAAALYRGVDPRQLLLYNAGYNEGAKVTPEHRNLPITIPVASQLPHAVGLAFAMRRSREDRVVLVFFGDGATSEGDFHEAMNFAAVLRVPVVFFCQNNQWAISTPRSRQSHSRTLAQKALAYGMKGVQVDGNDVLGVYEVTRKAVERARAGKGPCLIEGITYRLEVHTTADDPSKYRDEAEESAWAAREPLIRMERHLRGAGLLDDASKKRLTAEIDIELDNAWHAARQDMSTLGPDMDLSAHLFAENERRTEEEPRETADETNASEAVAHD